MDPIIKQEPLDEIELASIPLFRSGLGDISHIVDLGQTRQRSPSDASSSDSEEEERRIKKKIRVFSPSPSSSSSPPPPSSSSSSNTSNGPVSFVEVRPQIPEGVIQYPNYSDDEQRMLFERRIMGYFPWDPRQDQGELLCEWLEATGKTQDWAPSVYERFRIFLQSIGVTGMETCPITMTDNFTCCMDYIFRWFGIYNITIARIHPDYYIIIPIGSSKPKFDVGELTREETFVVDVWYPGYRANAPCRPDNAQGWTEDTDEVRDVIRRTYYLDDESYSIYLEQADQGPRMRHNGVDFISIFFFGGLETMPEF